MMSRKRTMSVLGMACAANELTFTETAMSAIPMTTTAQRRPRLGTNVPYAVISTNQEMLIELTSELPNWKTSGR